MGYPQRQKRKAINSKKCEYNGFKFDSKTEMSRYMELMMLARIGGISELEVHPCISIDVDGVHICKYNPDFRYKNKAGETVVEDVKGNWKNKKAFHATANWQIFRLKCKMLKAIYGIEVQVHYG